MVVYCLDRLEASVREAKEGNHAFLWMKVEAVRCGRMLIALVLFSREAAHGVQGFEECIRAFFA